MSNILNVFRNKTVTRSRSLKAIALVIPAMVLAFVSGFSQSTSTPSINLASSVYDSNSRAIRIKGSNFQSGAVVSLGNSSGPVAHGPIKIKGSKKIIITGVAESDIQSDIIVTILNPDGGSITANLSLSVVDEKRLSEDDVRTVIAQAVAQAESAGLRATIAVTDKEGNVLGIFSMNGAPQMTRVGVDKQCAPCGLEGRRVPSVFAAISKAGTGAFLSSQGHAFTTRTASFIVQEHFPPKVDFTGSGPLFGVQFSQLLCSDINPKLPLGLSADPGGVPLYKNGFLAGGVGVEGDGTYTADLDPVAEDRPDEEQVAVAATRGFETPAEIQGDKIIVNGIRFPFVNTPMPAATEIRPFDQLRGAVVVIPGLAPGIRGAQPSSFSTVTIGGLEGRVDNRFFPFRAGTQLSAADVEQMIVQAARQAFITRAAIRQPLSSAAEVNISVVDVDGRVLGIFSTQDAPIFGFDVSAQKARTAAFFTSPRAGRDLRTAEGGRFAGFVEAAARDGLALDGSVAFSDRAGGFLSRPFFPDGINGTEHGPFSVPIETFSPFNDGLQLDLLLAVIDDALSGTLRTGCTALAAIPNGIQIFPGSVPLFKNGRFAGGIGVSGDGVDQDDLVAAMGSSGFESPPQMRSDRITVRGVRLPFVKFPRHPNR